MFKSGLRFWIISISLLIFLVISTNHTITSYLYQTQGIIPSLGLRFLSLLLAIVLVMSFHGIGLLSCPLIGLKIFPKYMELPTRFFIGYLMASIGVYFLGFYEMLHKEIFFPVIFLGACISISKIVKISSYFSFLTKIFQKGNFEKGLIICVVVFLIGRLFPTLNFNSFGDPLNYSLPSGRDYLELGRFQWVEHAEFYWQSGLSDIGLIYLHSLTNHPMLVQLSAQAFYYLTGILFLLFILHKGFFSKLIPEKHSLWIAFSFISMSTFRLESIVAKPDYWLAVLFCLILVFLYEILSETNNDNLLSYWTAVLMLSGLCLSTKPTSILFLLPLAAGLLFFGKYSIPFTSLRFWATSILAASLGLMNTFKSIYIFNNPIFPFTNHIFLSPYWDQTASEGMRKLFRLESGRLIDFLQSILKFLLGHPVSFILLIAGLVSIFFSRGKLKFPKYLMDYLIILSFSWVIGLIFWILFFNPHVYPRFIIGFVFLTILLPTTFTIYNLKSMFPPKYLKWQNPVCVIALLLTLSVSHIDVDFQNAKHWLSSKSFHNQWLEDSSLAKVQNYLNMNVKPETRVLFHYSTKRFHANFIVYGARIFSPRTRFVFSKDKNEIMEGLKRIKPEYYVIRKDKIGIYGGLLENKLFLDENFKLLKSFKEYLIYKVNINFQIS